MSLHLYKIADIEHQRKSDVAMNCKVRSLLGTLRAGHRCARRSRHT